MEKTAGTTADDLAAENETLRAQLAALSRDNESLARENRGLAADLAAEHAEKAAMKAAYDAKIARLTELIRRANAREFGAESEKAHPCQALPLQRRRGCGAARGPGA